MPGCAAGAAMASPFLAPPSPTLDACDDAGPLDMVGTTMSVHWTSTSLCSCGLLPLSFNTQKKSMMLSPLLQPLIYQPAKTIMRSTILWTTCRDFWRSPVGSVYKVKDLVGIIRHLSIVAIELKRQQLRDSEES